MPPVFSVNDRILFYFYEYRSTLVNLSISTTITSFIITTSFDDAVC